MPDWVTLAVLFVLYANVPAVAVRFYGVPPLAAAMVFVLLGIPLAYHLIVRGRKLIVGRATLWAFLFVLTHIFSMAFCHEPERASETVVTSITEGFLVFFLVLNLVRTPEMLRRVTWTLLLAGSILGFLSGWQYKFGTMRKNYGGFAQVGISAALDATQYEKEAHQERRASGPIGEVNRYAQIMLMLVPLGFFRYLGEPRWKWRLAGLGAMGLAMVGMMFTFARGAAVGFLLLVMIAALMRYLTLRHCAMILVGAAVLVMASDNYRERLLSLTKLEASMETQGAEYDEEEVDSSFQKRDTEVRAAALMFLEHPIFGIGPGLYPRYYMEYAERTGGRIHKEDTEREPHMLYLGLGAELGVLGLGAYLITTSVVLWSLMRARRLCKRAHPDMAYMATGYMLAIVSYLFTGLFLHFSYVRYFWMMLALAAAAARIAVALSRERTLDPEEAAA